MGRGVENEYGLTAKQEKFVQNLFGGMTKRDAYLDAYDVKEGRDRDDVNTDAWELLQNPRVTKRLSELQEVARREIIYGAKEAFEDLKEDRAFARKHKAAGAAVTATKATMRLFGLDTATVALTDGEGNGLLASMSEEERLEKLKTQVSVLEPMLNKIGYKLVKMVKDGEN